MAIAKLGARVPAVPERYGWVLRVLLVFGLVYGVAAAVTVVFQFVQLLAWVQPGARVPIVMGTAYSLPTRAGRNEYAGIPFVHDGTAVVATQVATTLDEVPIGNRIALGVAPLLWTLTALLVTLLLGRVVWRLSRGAAFGSRLSRPVVIAAAVLAVGGSVAQVVQGVSALAFGAFAWAAPGETGSPLIRTDGFTFSFTPLFVACGLLAVALILGRGLALQRDVDGLV